MKVFISWSGELSREVASVLTWWVGTINQELEPFMSQESIDSGERWAQAIASELETTSVGIICVTKGNINRPWLNFESGALSKVDTARVIPFLYNMKPSDLLKSPLSLFQARAFTKEDMYAVAETLNSLCTRTLEPARLREFFNAFWGDAENRLKALSEIPDLTPENVEPGRQVEEKEILEEILELVREHQKSSSSLATPVPDFIAQYLDTGLDYKDLVLLPTLQLRGLIRLLHHVLPLVVETFAESRGVSDSLWKDLSRIHTYLEMVADYAQIPFELQSPTIMRQNILKNAGRQAASDDNSSNFDDVPF